MKGDPDIGQKRTFNFLTRALNDIAMYPVAAWQPKSFL